MTDEIEIRIWEMQDWETTTQYMYFHTYYFMQPAPRSIIGAYRAYKAEQKRLPVNAPEILKINKLPTNWSRMAYALDRDNKKRTDGAVGWSKRAAAFDAFQVRRLNEMTAQRRITATFDSLDTIDSMLARLKEMIEFARVLKTTSRKETTESIVDENGNKHDIPKIIEMRAVNEAEYAALVRTYDMLRSMQLRELGQPSVIRQNNIANNEGDEFSIVGKGFADMLTDAYQQIQDYKKAQRGNASQPAFDEIDGDDDE